MYVKPTMRIVPMNYTQWSLLNDGDFIWIDNCGMQKAYLQMLFPFIHCIILLYTDNKDMSINSGE